MKRLIVAIGGNAIVPAGDPGDAAGMRRRLDATAERLVDLVAAGHELIVTHGNGPQVGNILRRVELASSELYPIPLEVCVADTQAGMGYMIAQCLSNAMGRRNLTNDVTAVVTTVIVDRDDPAFANPSKAIGQPLPADLAEKHRTEDGWKVREEKKGWFRRVVPSPLPRKIIELPAIERLLAAGQIVVCCGGGGIPVAVDQWGRIRGAAAVIDKDRTTALLAGKLAAPTLVILTAVEQVCLNFGQPNEVPLERLTASEAEKHAAAGEFGAGSMRPKIEAAVDFVRHSPHADATAIIAHLDRFADALDGRSGTRIVRN